MGVEIPIGYAQARFAWSLTGDQESMYCTVGINPASGDTALEIAEAVHNAWQSNTSTAPMMYSGFSLGPTQVQFRQDANPPVIAEFGTTLAGTGIGETLPANCAFLVKKQTNLGGRRNRGRMYLPPVYQAEGGVSKNGLLESSAVSLFTSRLQGFRAAVELGSRELVILHADGGGPTPITALSMDPLIATQRRRLRP